jgi:hypothetical protein
VPVLALQYKGMFTDCLKRAAEELRAGGHEGGDLPDSGQLAERIEAAFHKHYGELLIFYTSPAWGGHGLTREPRFDMGGVPGAC